MKNDMEKLTSDMEFLMGSKLKIVVAHQEAVSHLSKAKNLLENAGLTKEASFVDVIVQKAINGGF